MDVVETDDHYVLRADLPGLSEGDVKIEVDDNVLTVSGERKSSPQGDQAGLLPRRALLRALLAHADASRGRRRRQHQRHFDRGVLEVKVPKPEQRKPRKVEISVGATQPAIEADAATDAAA